LLINNILNILIKIYSWGLGIGDWGLGIGDWGLGPIPNPQSPFFFLIFKILKYFLKLN